MECLEKSKFLLFENNLNIKDNLSFLNVSSPSNRNIISPLDLLNNSTNP